MRLEQEEREKSLPKTKREKKRAAQLARDPLVQLLQKSWERLIRLRIARDKLEQIKQEEISYERYYIA